MTDTCSRGCKSGWDDFLVFWFIISILYLIYKCYQKRENRYRENSNGALKQAAIDFEQKDFNPT